MLEGELQLRYADGTEEVTSAGEFFYWPAGHLAWTPTGVVIIDVVSTADVRYVNETLGY